MILIVDMNCKKASLGFEEFVLPLVHVVNSIEACEVTHYTEIKEVETYTKVILSGACLKDGEYLKRRELFEWLKTCTPPVLGICAGMQIIGLIFNSSVISCREIGMTDITVVKENTLFSTSFRAYELHNYGIEPSPTFDILARSEKCVQAVKHKEKRIYGLLFHPEVRNSHILELFVLL